MRNTVDNPSPLLLSSFLYSYVDTGFMALSEISKFKASIYARIKKKELIRSLNSKSCFKPLDYL